MFEKRRGPTMTLNDLDVTRVDPGPVLTHGRLFDALVCFPNQFRITLNGLENKPNSLEHIYNSLIRNKTECFR